MKEKIITAIIIEDDEKALSLLDIFLQAFEEVEVLEKTTKPQAGLKLLRKHVPDIVFLDIDMPGLNGLEVAQVIRDKDLKTEVVFTTAHSRYAMRALNIEPLDYLIKPFGPDELLSVINRYKAKIKSKHLEKRMNILINNSKSVPKARLTTRTGIIFINPDDVIMIQAESNYCRIFTIEKKEVLITLNINRVVTILDTPGIMKASRSAYINMKYLKKIEKKNKTCLLQYKDIKLETPISRSGLSYIEKMNCFPII